MCRWYIFQYVIGLNILSLGVLYIYAHDQQIESTVVILLQVNLGGLNKVCLISSLKTIAH